MRSWFLVGLALLASSASYAARRDANSGFGIALRRCSARIAHGAPHPELVTLMRKSKNNPHFVRMILARLEANHFDLRQALLNFYLGRAEYAVFDRQPAVREPLDGCPPPHNEFSALGYFRKIFAGQSGSPAEIEARLDDLLERLWSGYPLLAENLLVEALEEDTTLYPTLHWRWQDLVGEEEERPALSYLQWILRGFPRTRK